MKANNPSNNPWQLGVARRLAMRGVKWFKVPPSESIGPRSTIALGRNAEKRAARLAQSRFRLECLRNVVAAPKCNSPAHIDMLANRRVRQRNEAKN